MTFHFIFFFHRRIIGETRVFFYNFYIQYISDYIVSEYYYSITQTTVLKMLSLYVNIYFNRSFINRYTDPSAWIYLHVLYITICIDEDLDSIISTFPGPLIDNILSTSTIPVHMLILILLIQTNNWIRKPEYQSQFKRYMYM